jgi:hypothetical protein
VVRYDKLFLSRRRVNLAGIDLDRLEDGGAYGSGPSIQGPSKILRGVKIRIWYDDGGERIVEADAIVMAFPDNLLGTEAISKMSRLVVQARKHGSRTCNFDEE